MCVHMSVDNVEEKEAVSERTGHEKLTFAVTLVAWRFCTCGQSCLNPYSLLLSFVLPLLRNSGCRCLGSPLQRYRTMLCDGESRSWGTEGLSKMSAEEGQSKPTTSFVHKSLAKRSVRCHQASLSTLHEIWCGMPGLPRQEAAGMA